MLRYDVQILSLVHVYCVQRTMAMGIANLASVCPRSSDPFYIINCYIKWVITSWTVNTISKEFI